MQPKHSWVLMSVGTGKPIESNEVNAEVAIEIFYINTQQTQDVIHYDNKCNFITAIHNTSYNNIFECIT